MGPCPRLGEQQWWAISGCAADGLASFAHGRTAACDVVQGLHLQGPADLSVVDNNAVVITCANEADALQVGGAAALARVAAGVARGRPAPT